MVQRQDDEYRNYGQVGAMGANARSDYNNFSQRATSSIKFSVSWSRRITSAYTRLYHSCLLEQRSYLRQMKRNVNQ
jgi:hypothetical protein